MPDGLAVAAATSTGATPGEGETGPVQIGVPPRPTNAVPSTLAFTGGYSLRLAVLGLVLLAVSSVLVMGHHQVAEQQRSADADGSGA